MKIACRHPFAVICFWVGLLAADRLDLFRMGLAASILHETGHILAYRRLIGRWPRVEVELTGIRMPVDESKVNAGQMLILAAAGPGVNLLLAAAVLAGMQFHAGYGGYCFAAINLMTAIFNLLPVASLDGRRILEALICICRENRVK